MTDPPVRHNFSMDNQNSVFTCSTIATPSTILIILLSPVRSLPNMYARTTFIGFHTTILFLTTLLYMLLFYETWCHYHFYLQSHIASMVCIAWGIQPHQKAQMRAPCSIPWVNPLFPLGLWASCFCCLTRLCNIFSLIFLCWFLGNML